MNLEKKKRLAARTLGVGLGRIVLNTKRIEEIKEAITKQDIRDLFKAGAISIKEKKGRRKVESRKWRRGAGKIKNKAKNRKQEYVKITRKLRNYLKELKRQEKVSPEDYKEFRKGIRRRDFRSKSHLQSTIKK